MRRETEDAWLAAFAPAEMTSADAPTVAPLEAVAAAVAWCRITVREVSSAQTAPPAAGAYWMDLAEAVTDIAAELELLGAAGSSSALETVLGGRSLPDTPELRAGVARALAVARTALDACADTSSGRARLQTVLAARAVDRALTLAASG